MALIHLPSGLEPRTAQNLYSKTDVEKGLTEFLLDALERSSQLKPQHKLVNQKMIFSVICCSVASYGQFQCKMPEDGYFMSYVVLFYFFLSALAFFFDKLYVGATFVGEFQYQDGENICLHLSMQLFSDEVEMILIQGNRKESSKKSCGKYYCEDGVLDQQATFDELNHLLRALVKKKRN
eukprot:GEMP01044856.1.p1 GENE.GEMP01044856.1~~GEMP01044856.1.p1  ORF type:complete len:180 (+),score=29.64 GEMP01044856.1:115-654(+)